MIVLRYLTLRLIEALLVPFSISHLPGQTCLLLSSRLVNTCVLLLRTTYKLPNVFSSILGVPFILALPLPLAFLPSLLTVMPTGLVIQWIASLFLVLWYSLAIAPSLGQLRSNPLYPDHPLKLSIEH